MADVVLQGVPSYAPPGVYVQLLFSQGNTGLPTSVYSAIILANCTSQGSQASCTPGTTFGPDTLIPCQTAAQAVALFGSGSPAAIMYQAFQAINPTTPLYVAPVAAATGTQASQTITITAVGSASGQTTGVIQYQVDGKIPAQAVFASTDSATTISTSLAAAINSNVNLPVTAVGSGGTVVITAKVAGSRGNDLRGFATVVSGSGVTPSIVSPANLTSGAGSDGSGYTATLNALATNGSRYYYYIPECGADSVDGYSGNNICVEVQAQIDSMSLPAIGVRQRAVFGSNDTLPHTSATASQLDDPRLEIVWCNQLDLTPGELAANWAAAITLFETNPLNATGVNFDGFGSDAGSQPFWRVQAPLDGSAPSSTDIQTAIISGVSPLRRTPGGNTAVVKRCTTRFFTLSGATEVLDLSITDAGKVTICDRFFDTLQNLIALRFPRMLIGNDPPAGSPPAGPGVVTVDKVTDACLEVIGSFASAGLINGPATTQGLVVQRNSNPTTAIGIVVPLFVADPAHQFLILGLQNPSVLI